MSEVLLEIQRDRRKKDNNENPEKVLILVHDRQTCYQLKNFLTMGANEYLLNEAHKKLQRGNLHKSRYAIEKNFYRNSTYRNLYIVSVYDYIIFFK